MKKSDLPQPALTRRSFLKRSSAVVGGAFFGATTLQMLAAHNAWAASTNGQGDRGDSPNATGYGPLQRTPDQNGNEILALPDGFHYVTFGAIGSELLGGNGLLHARNLDGMAAFAGPNGTVRLIRNHEVRNAPTNGTLAVGGDSALKYDDSPGVGGTTTLDFDPIKRKVVNEFISATGTIVNCAGGKAYLDSGWITCEETTAGPKQGWKQKHGYAFLVPADAIGTVKAEPIKAMGRFAHEAAVADFQTGVVYQTEDAGSGRGSGFYRFLPVNPANLLAGGTLQILAVRNSPQYDARQGQSVGPALPADWITIPNPDPDLENAAKTVFDQGFELGATKFNRLEGIHRGVDGSIFFVSTSGGNIKNGDVNSDGFAEGYGQIWQYRPDTQELVLVYESTGLDVLDSPDNLAVSPRGGIILCEDDAGSADEATDVDPLAPGITNVNRLIGLTREGQPFRFAVNILNDTEFAGACFSPDGKVLFVNVFGDGAVGSGMTIAIYGPFERGPL